MDGDSLVRLLRAYDAPVDAAAVRAALADAKSTDLARWATTHLTPDTLLTVDELSQYAALEESGLAERLVQSSELTATCALSDRELEDAIEELNRSTQAIARNTESLKQQQEALCRLVNAEGQATDERAAIQAQQALKWAAQHKDLELAVADLSHSLNSRAAELEERSGGAGTSIQTTVDTLFHADDKLLSSLQKLGWELQTEDVEDQKDVVMLRETCARLIKFTVEGIRTKLDRIYLESLELSAPSGSANRASAHDVSALQEEVESLYAEILPVAQMSTEQQFLEPALKSLAAKNGQGLARSVQATNYIHDCLDHLIDRARDLAARVEAFQAYRVAANAVLDIAKPELTTVAPSFSGASHGRHKSISQQNTMSPVRPPPKRRPRYSSDTVGTADESPLDEILRALAINPLPDEDQAADVLSQTQQLAATLASRRAKLDDVAQNVQQSFERGATKQLADAKLAIQLVRDSILAESPFGEVRLVDAEIEGSIAVLSQEIANVDEKLKAVAADAAKLRGKNPKRDELISRWGS